MSEKKWSSNIKYRSILGIIAFVAIIYLIAQNIGVFSKVAMVFLGFGAVVLVHEFGHFVVAKLCGVKVEAFSIFMPPILFGVRRTQDGLRFRILPQLFPKEGDQSGEGALSFTIGRKGVASETEYRIGLIPFGGFVKMLGQDDVGPVKKSSDPRSFANKPFIVRAPILAAGVIFNALSAIIIFMIVFLIGIDLMPPVVGGVIPNSPAARAGLKGGDEIIEVGGKKDNLDFSNIGVAAALSDVNEAVPLKIKHKDGSIEEFILVAERLKGQDERAFGILPPVGMSLTIGELSANDANDLYVRTGLRPGDHIKSVDGNDVRDYWELAEAAQNTFAPEVALSAKRTRKSGKIEQVDAKVRLDLSPAGGLEVKSEAELGHIFSMVPRLRIAAVAGEPEQVKAASLWYRFKHKIAALFGKAGQTKTGERPDLKNGDIIVAIGEAENPTYKEMREITEKYEGKKLEISVLRAGQGGVEQTVRATVVPKRPPGSKRVLIGIGVVLDAEHPVVAKTIDVGDGLAKLEIPRGATITAVDGTKVSSFYDVIREIRRYSGERITIDYRLNEQAAGDVVLDVSNDRKFIAVESILAEGIPLENLKRCYKARGADLPSRLANAVVLGCEKTVTLIAVTYMSIKRIVGGLVSPRSLYGPVGIIVLSYHIVAEQPFIYYVYFLGLISAIIAVFNFLPLPPFDGGLIVLLLVEKIKGSALSERTQEVIVYAGWALVAALFIYVTFNDIVRSIFG